MKLYADCETVGERRDWLVEAMKGKHLTDRLKTALEREHQRLLSLPSDQEWPVIDANKFDHYTVKDRRKVLADALASKVCKQYNSPEAIQSWKDELLHLGLAPSDDIPWPVPPEMAWRTPEKGSRMTDLGGEPVFWSDQEQGWKNADGKLIATQAGTLIRIKTHNPHREVPPMRPASDPYAPPPVQPWQTSSPSPVSALDEAAAIVTGPRRAAYGHPLDNHTRTAAMWSAFLGVPVTAEQVCWMNILQKASRNVCSDQRDNVVDTIGYAANIDIIKLEREQREAR